VSVDLAHGGRLTSLRLAGREWLWTNPAPARAHVRPGDPFVDAGGLEECLPTVRGTPDHGAAWSRPWRRLDAWSAEVTTGDFALTRTISATGDSLVLVYRLRAAAGWPFVWAAHALLDLSDEARLVAPAGAGTRVYQDAGPWLPGTWPAPLGTPLDALGPSDGTAVGAILTDRAAVRVVDGAALSFHLEPLSPQPVSVALWRNLGGFPQPSPYRSIGVEPMLGKVFDLAEAGPGDAARVPSSGECGWRLTITATR